MSRRYPFTPVVLESALLWNFTWFSSPITAMSRSLAPRHRLNKTCLFLPWPAPGSIFSAGFYLHLIVARLASDVVLLNSSGREQKLIKSLNIIAGDILSDWLDVWGWWVTLKIAN